MENKIPPLRFCLFVRFLYVPRPSIDAEISVPIYLCSRYVIFDRLVKTARLFEKRSRS